jgi:spore germination protein YaaH
VQSLIERSLVGNQSEYVAFEKFLEKLSYMIITLAIEYYTDDRLMRMKAEDPNGDVEYEYIPFTAEFFKEIAWDFSIDITQKLKHTEQSNQEKMRMLAEWQLQYSPDISIVTPEDMIKAFNPANRDVILARIEQERQQKSMENAQMIAQTIMQAMEQIQVQQMQMEQAQAQAMPQPMEGGGMEPGQPMSPEMQMEQQRELDPMQVITQIVFQALNPQKQGLGDVQKRQQGAPGGEPQGGGGMM